MSNNRVENLVIEDAKLMFRNFAGRETKFNREGKKTFCVVINPEDVDNLRAIGWNVKELEPRTPDEDPRYYLQVQAKFDNIPPKVTLITSRAKTPLDEESIGSLDYAEIRTADVILSPYHWEWGGKTGITAYLKTMYVTIEEDEFAVKYE